MSYHISNSSVSQDIKKAGQWIISSITLLIKLIPRLIIYFPIYLSNNPHHSSNPINHSQHPTAQNPIQNHRPRNRKYLTSNPEHLSLRVCQYRTKKFYRKIIILQLYFNYFLYFQILIVIISYLHLIYWYICNILFVFNSNKRLSQNYSRILHILLYKIPKHPIFPLAKFF